ncbi:hypothetical protein HMPREF1550_00652 [Actinomyces sp. oral taxon 877 str. F0543]|nr:hypothetical protein HMPREF1550_00652 [Actinomyces sp. oral taxon 877 str. F0543]
MRLFVREHPAPSGALRHLVVAAGEGGDVACQGAPSTIRCIKTFANRMIWLSSPERSGSTQHHQVH